MRRLACALPLALAFGCASQTKMAPQERATVERELTGPASEKYLRLSYFVMPFFGDGSKKLLSHLPPDEVRLVEHPGGEPVNPGAVEKILPAGTRVRITRVEFPTAWVFTERVPYTPRWAPWVYLEVADQPRTHPFILVLRQGIETHQDFLSELGRYLADRDLQPVLSAFSEPVREAIRKKTAVTDMPAEALEMAWGYPEVKRRELQGQSWRETWVYPGRRRIAHVVDGRLEKTETGSQ